MGQRILAILLALAGAFFLAFGVWIQSCAVKKISPDSGSGYRKHVKIWEVLTMPSWLGGGGVLITGMVCNVSALALAPLTVVQPLGAVALVITTVLNARFQKYRLGRNSFIAIALCIFGSISFVLLAINVTKDSLHIGREHEKVLLVIMVVINVTCLLAALIFRKTLNAFWYIVGAGILFGFVAVLTRITVIDLFENFRNILQLKGYTVLICLGLAATAALGTWFVQCAYATGPPELVIAGLTVIDPIVGVAIGVSLLGELKENVGMPETISMTVAALIAISGVMTLARYHPEVARHSGKANVVGAPDFK